MRKVLLSVLAAALVAGGCEWFEDPTPEQVHIVIEGDAGKQVRLIISRNFVTAGNEEGTTRLAILGSDTVYTTLPFDKTYSLRDQPRFFIEATRTDADLQSVRMQVFIDNEKEFDRSRALIGADKFRFVYSFNQPVTQDIVVL